MSLKGGVRVIYFLPNTMQVKNWCHWYILEMLSGELTFPMSMLISFEVICVQISPVEMNTCGTNTRDVLPSFAMTSFVTWQNMRLAGSKCLNVDFLKTECS